MKITIIKIPHEQHIKYHNPNKYLNKIVELLRENSELKQEIFKLKKELKQYEFEEYVAEKLDFIQVFNDPTNKRVKLNKNATYGYED